MHVIKKEAKKMNKQINNLSRIIILFVFISIFVLPVNAEEEQILASSLYGKDAYDDLAIGVPWESRGTMFDNNGLVDVLYAKYLGVDGTDAQEWMQGINGVQGVTEDDDNFGYALTTGDFNGDNLSDLVISAPFEDTGTYADAGVIHVLYGTPSGISADNDQMFYEDNAGGTTEANDEFGFSLAAGDFNCDRYDDLAIGIPYEDLGSIVNAGAVTVIYGSPNGLFVPAGNQYWHQDRSGVDDVAETDDHFGYTLASGDFNGDHCADLAIGVPDEDYNGHTDAGVAHVFYGGASGISTSNLQFWHQDQTGIIDDCEDMDLFGLALNAGDFDGNGYDDLAVGAPFESLFGQNYAGAVNVIYGTSNGLNYQNNQIWHQDIANIEDSVEAGDLFGRALASGDINADGYDDLAVGVPHEVYETVINAGVVNVIYGSNNRLTTTGDQLLFQSTTNRNEDEKFGWALAMGFFNGDEYCDLAIGVPGGVVNGNVEAGEINVLYGFSTGIATFYFYINQDSDGVPGTVEAYDNFGFALATLGLKTYHTYIPVTFR